jgi:hypothetical protein
MHLISIDASPKQLSKLRNGHKVRVKHGKGVSVIVDPSTYNLVSKAFAKQKGLEIQLSPEMMQANRSLSPEQHQQLKEVSQPHTFHSATSGMGIYSSLKKAVNHPVAKRLIKKYAPEVVGDLTAAGTTYMTGNPEMGAIARHGAKSLVEQGFKSAGYGLYAGHGRGLEALQQQNAGSAQANRLLAKYQGQAVEGQHSQSPIKSYWDDMHAPPSRGSGLKAHHHRPHDMNLMQGRGSLQSSEHSLPPALRSQPYGMNWQMQFFLPPEYQHYNKGTL